MQSPDYASFWIALLVGIASGSVGPFILLRRIALVGDALSQLALPGIALALVYGFDPCYGVVVPACDPVQCGDAVGAVLRLGEALCVPDRFPRLGPGAWLGPPAVWGL